MERADLRRLARDRRLRTRELYPFNAFYGHAELLRTYAGVRDARPLKATVEHGPSLVPNPADPDLAAHLPRYLCAAPAQAEFFEQHALHGARAAPIGPLILYARALAPPTPPPAARSLVFFDAHSSHYATAVYDVGAAASRLAGLRDEFDEVVVCLYWRDVLLGRAELYESHGFRCVTAGHMFDPRFLYRLVEIISAAAVVLTDRPGSHLFYAVALERPVWLEPWPVAYALADDAPKGTVGPQEGAAVERAFSLFRRQVDRVEAEQRAFADDVCGISQFRAPGELAELLAEAEAAYRSETPVRWKAGLAATATARRLWNARPW